MMGLIAIFVLSAALLVAQAPTRLYVEPFDGALHDQLVEQLKKDSRVAVVDSATNAQMLVAGSGQTWIKGYISANPRVRYRNSDAQPVYTGYLSVELKDKRQQTVWSWLATPGRFDPHDINRNLAERVAPRLVSAVTAHSTDGAARTAGVRGGAALTAAGATFPYPLYQKWFDSFGADIRYSAVGSSAGIEALRKGAVDFAASDMPLSDELLATMPFKVRHVPTAIGGVVPIYSVAGLAQDLRFTPEALAGIFLGRIHRWDDPVLKAANPRVALPAREITVVHRADGSGTTFVWTNYLSAVSDAWKSGPGHGLTVEWPAGISAQGNEGVAELVRKTPDSMGYVEYIYALQNQLNYGSVRNRAGRFVQASLETLTAAAASMPGDVRAPIVNAPGANAYPIASFTYLLIPERPADTPQRETLDEFLRWMLTSGQKECAALGYASLPAAVAQRALP
jgi:phosphate transport system substrate-binding protein